LSIVFLVLFVGFTQALPFFQVVATSPFDLGFQIGTTFAEEIQTYVKNDSFLWLNAIPWQKSNMDIYDQTVEMNAAIFPDHMQELQGWAAGANVSFEALMLMNMGDEISTALGMSPKEHRGGKACTDIMLNGPYVMAHNEDAGPSVKPLAFLIQVQLMWLQNTTQVSRFTAYTYPGFLSGMAWGFNDYIAYACNAVFPIAVSLPGLVRYFINRDILASTSAEDALNRLTIQNISLGFSVNIGAIPNSNQGPAMYNVEIAQNQTNILTVIPGNYSEHFNMYRRLKVPQYTDNSSVHREARANQMGPPTDMYDILQILGDTQDPQYPIFRDAVPPDCCSTVATVAFDLQNLTASVYQANPKTSDPVYFFDLAFR